VQRAVSEAIDRFTEQPETAAATVMGSGVTNGVLQQAVETQCNTNAARELVLAADPTVANDEDTIQARAVAMLQKLRAQNTALANNLVSRTALQQGRPDTNAIAEAAAKAAIEQMNIQDGRDPKITELLNIREQIAKEVKDKADVKRAISATANGTPLEFDEMDTEAIQREKARKGHQDMLKARKVNHQDSIMKLCQEMGWHKAMDSAAKYPD